MLKDTINIFRERNNNNYNNAKYNNMKVNRKYNYLQIKNVKNTTKSVKFP